MRAERMSRAVMFVTVAKFSGRLPDVPSLRDYFTCKLAWAAVLGTVLFMTSPGMVTTGTAAFAILASCACSAISVSTLFIVATT